MAVDVVLRVDNCDVTLDDSAIFYAKAELVMDKPHRVWLRGCAGAVGQTKVDLNGRAITEVEVTGKSNVLVLATRFHALRLKVGEGSNVIFAKACRIGTLNGFAGSKEQVKLGASVVGTNNIIYN